ERVDHAARRAAEGDVRVAGPGFALPYPEIGLRAGPEPDQTLPLLDDGVPQRPQRGGVEPPARLEVAHAQHDVVDHHVLPRAAMIAQDPPAVAPIRHLWSDSGPWAPPDPSCAPCVVRSCSRWSAAWFS